MKTLQFNPQVFRISFDQFNGTSTWDLLTIDGESPRETVYFMLKGDAPSSTESNIINKSIEGECWEKMSLEESGFQISDFIIDVKIFDTAGEAYEAIRNELSELKS